MKVYLLSLFLGFWLQMSFSQQINKDSISYVRDSLRRVYEARMLEFKKQQELFKEMFNADPKRAMDSVNLTRIESSQGRGIKRLDAYEVNTRLDTLESIDLSYAGLKKIPDWVFEAKNLKYLNLSFNTIRKIPGKLKRLKQLRSINWSGNFLEDIWWIHIVKLRQLSFLDISNNSLSRMPFALRKLKRLEQLNLGECDKENLSDDLENTHVYSFQESNINFWFEDEELSEIQWGPISNFEQPLIFAN